jgi:hypothetical protein
MEQVFWAAPDKIQWARPAACPYIQMDARKGGRGAGKLENGFQAEVFKRRE